VQRVRSRLLRGHVADTVSPPSLLPSVGDDPLALFRDYPSQDSPASAEHKSLGVTVRSLPAALKPDSVPIGLLTKEPFTVNGLPIRVLIDSGSQISLVSYELVRKLRETNRIDIPTDCADCPPGLVVRSVTGQPLPILGMLLLEVKAPSGKSVRAQFLVQKFGLGNDMVIGTNYLARLGYSLMTRSHFDRTATNQCSN
jgi:hypothetical protein